jgi:hypothetical protein
MANLDDHGSLMVLNLARKSVCNLKLYDGRNMATQRQCLQFVHSEPIARAGATFVRHKCVQSQRH